MREISIEFRNSVCSAAILFLVNPDHDLDIYMTGLLHEGKFHVRDLLEPAIFGSLHQGLEISANGSENVTIYQAK